MSMFFPGWRRKLGCVTLVLTCVLMLAWIRSPLNSDRLFLELGTSTVVLASNQNGLWYATTHFSDHRYHPTMLRAQSDVFSLPGRRMPFSDDPFNHLQGWDWNHESRWDYCGFHLGEFRNEKHFRDICLKFRIVPHWFVVIPSTAVAAFLLRSKPPRATTNSATRIVEGVEDCQP